MDIFWDNVIKKSIELVAKVYPIKRNRQICICFNFENLLLIDSFIDYVASVPRVFVVFYRVDKSIVELSASKFRE